MKTLSLLLGASAGAAALVLAAAPAQAGGFYLQEQSVKGTGRAYSGEVADTGAESLWWNPASIARIPTQGEVYVGVNLVKVNADVNNAGSTATYGPGVTVPVGGADRAINPVNTGVLPNFAVAYRLNDRFTVGVAATSPFNFTTNYKGSDWTRYEGLKSRLNNVDLGLSGAMKVTDWLDLGLGVDASYMDSTLTSAVTVSPLLPDGRESLTGDGWDFGWNVGAQVHTADNRLSVGASYRSAIEHELDGQVAISGLVGPAAGANFSTGGKAKFTTPWIATLGARYAATDKLTLNAQVQRIGWSEFDAIVVTIPGKTLPTVENYKDTTTVAVGFDYKAAPQWTVRAGVQYDPTPTNDNFRDPRVPDGDRWDYAAGASWEFQPGRTADFGIQYINFEDSKIHNDTVTPTGVPVSLRGDVSGHALVLSGGLRWQF
ncbi:long-chain fatty acid transporter [Caulobacter sp. CCUG 60055]|uniref:OmpP1/FadL family transporter n=1 Tax=Caulobacter sp. CCUG 60055 TaxID=2100090 RepID=UPI001FA7EEE3|nr:outer membrane protein transport protein [Caulobacter sp. CCUG 60055]MBQ1541352.1 outer membrane protein transport protein [Caulobacteraceae bacterium]MCI3182029.1 long-chain fatty acid transporter [Caulobacter sp. CCUG 60055]